MIFFKEKKSSLYDKFGPYFNNGLRRPQKNNAKYCEVIDRFTVEVESKFLSKIFCFVVRFDVSLISKADLITTADDFKKFFVKNRYEFG